VTDLDRRFRALDVLEPPDLWARAEALARSADLVAPEPRRRPVWVLVAAALATIAVIGGVAWAIRLGREDPAPPVVTSVATTVPTTTVPETTVPPTTEPPTTTVPPTTTTTLPPTTTTLAAPGLDPAVAAAWADWTLILPEEDPALFTGTGHIINDISAGGGLLVAVGDSGGSEENFMRDGLILISSDGLAWERVSDPDDLEFGGKGLNAVIAAGPGYVVAGGSCDTEERGPFLPALWTSADGLEWDRVPHDPELFGDRGGIYDLRIYDSRILASGVFCVGEVCSWAVWSSPDGFTWERVWESEESWATRMVAGDSNLLAFGDEAIWISGDGLTWEPVPRDPEVFGEDPEAPWVVYDMAFGSAGFVAVGTDGTDAIVWLSLDGLTWERLPHDPEVFGDSSMKSVIPWGDGYLAVGPEWAIGEELGGPVPGLPSVPGPPEIWASPDGRTWHRIAIGEEAAAIRSVVESAGSLVAVGQNGTFIEGEDAVWINDTPPEGN
jgi:hypothetical protein